MILEGLNAPKEPDVRVFRTSTIRFAQFIADTILSAVCCEEGGHFLVRPSRLCDSTFIERELGPRLNFSHDPHSLRIDNHSDISKAIVSMSFRNETFRMAAVDYSTVLKWSVDTPFHCYRAQESLYQHFDGKSEKCTNY